MKKINMVDLNGQYRKIRWQVNREIKKVIKSSSFINGPSVKEFQDNLQNFLGIRHVIPCANGTDALQVALMSLELNKGDEVITTNFSFASTIEVILLLGLKPVVVDIDPKTFNINPSLIKNKISDKTKAIIFEQAGRGSRPFSDHAHTYTHKFKKLCRGIGMESYVVHSLRHYGCTALFDAGLNSMQVSSISGHTDLKMLKRYTHIRASSLLDMLPA